MKNGVRFQCFASVTNLFTTFRHRFTDDDDDTCATNGSKNIKISSLHSPTLKASSHEGYITESAQMGTAVRVSPSAFSNSLQIDIYDDDLKPGMSPVSYEYILTGLGSSIFAVDQRGYVYLNVPHIDADPPNPSTYQLHIEAREVNTTPIRSSEPISVTIHVMDINDNPPRFSSSIYTASVSANGIIDRPVIKIYATDNDTGKKCTNKLPFGVNK
ncbi:hypothetical protein WUBG_08781 [Wuchereria bancrofti]|uniref:Cadherin domain-containing protein n=1 Tax=Wuchereria bancrofti TaxID=6293 RepID=J9B099_WUCBA|nr:hypothetical protein WUBG_08781 [Wuchereria bancrofti]